MPQHSGKGEGCWAARLRKDAGCVWTCTIHATAKSKGRMRYLRLLRREAHGRHLLMWHHTLLRWHAAHRPRGMLRGPQRGPAGAWRGSKSWPRRLHCHPSWPWRSRALHKQHSLSTHGCLHSGAVMRLSGVVAYTSSRLHARHMLCISLIPRAELSQLASPSRAF